MKQRILIAEDSEITRKQLRELLESEHAVEVDTTSDGKEALQALCDRNYSLFLTDLRMPRLDGMQLIEEIKRRRIPVTIIVMTGFGSIDQAVQAMRLGAGDFLTKPIDVDHLRVVIARALRERTLQDEVVSLRDQLQNRFTFQNIISKNPRMHAIFEMISNVAHTTTTVLVTGETGTGKEGVARAIHQASAPYRKGPMVALNCAALPETLLESELFGHEKGAFTSAAGQRRGRFEMSNEGTIFLDEIGDISPSTQAKLLRVLQERRFERVGGHETVEVDVRVIAATNKNLYRMVKQDKFREDLYYRLNVIKIDLPPLKERPEDIPLLATHFAQKFARHGEPPREVTPEAMEILLRHDWPGNIRELENVVERSCVTCRGGKILPEDLPAELSAPKTAPTAYKVDLARPLPDLLKEATEGLEKAYLRKALKKSRGNIGRCAKICGLSRRSISAKIAEYGIEKSEFKQE